MARDDGKSLLEQEDGLLLLRAIQRKKCILLLGPGVAVPPGDPAGEPLTVQLARTLAAKLRQEGKSVVSETDLAHVAEVYQRENRKGRAGLRMAVESFYAPYRDTTTPLHTDLAALPFALCVSTTPDRFLLTAFEQTPGKTPIYDFHNFQPDPKRARERPAFRSPPEREPEKSPLVYDLYGSFDEPNSLVLTENHLLDFLVSVASHTPPLHPYVSTQFRDSTVSFLFLGFGFQHWYMRILLHVLKAAGQKEPSLEPSWALEDAAFFSRPDVAETALFFQRGHLLDFKQLPPDFAARLRERYEAQLAVKPKSAAAPTLPADAPVAFLCHENRDKPEVERLRGELELKGIKCWVDDQNLRGGDNWRKAIPNVIWMQCDYLVVLQSPNMADKPESYFKAEIAEGLERQKQFGELRFVIPVILAADSRLPLRELSRDLHCIDLPRQGVQAIAQSILEDWQTRAAMKGQQ
jgi:hypothetical protein